MDIFEIQVKDLKADPENARRHSQANIETIKNSLKRFGQQKPIVVDAKNIIVAGNGTWEAAKALGWETIRVARTKLRGKDRKAFAILDNRSAELAEWDNLVLDAQLRDLSLQDVDIGELGFPDWNFIDGLPDPNTEATGEPVNPPTSAQVDNEDAIPTQVETVCQKGQLWALGRHRLLCGSSTVREDVLRLTSGEKIDMIFTDPPYGINETGNRSKRGLLTKGCDLPDFKDDSIEYAITAYRIASELDIPIQVWWGANYYCHGLPQTGSWFVWDKRVEEKFRDNNSDCELAWVKGPHNSVRIFRHLWKGLIKGSETSQKRVHPTQKPIALAEWAYEYFKDIKTVLDLFGGSGSSLIACEKTDRTSFTMELEPYYCDVIIKRWEQFTGQKATRVDQP